MDSREIARQLQTVCAIHVTPFDDATGAIRWDLLDANIDHLLAAGVSVIVTCGNTGEFYALTLEEARAVTAHVARRVDGRALVVAGVGYAVPTAIELARSAADAGADCVMIHQPIHPYVTEDGFVRYCEQILDGAGLPAVLYFKDPALGDGVLERLAQHERLAGVKYAVNDLPRFAATVRRVPAERGLSLVCGTAEKWAPFFFAAGATGFTSGLVNVAPDKSLAMLAALQAGDAAAVWRLWQEVVPFENLRAKYNNGNNVVVVKEAMRAAGLDGGVTREPVAPLGERDRTEVARIVAAWRGQPS